MHRLSGGLESERGVLLGLLQGPQAASADAHADGHPVYGYLSLLKVRHPATVGVALGMTDVVAVCHSFATDLAQRQVVTP